MAKMNNINEVISNLYEALVLIRYPGIAQVDISNLESTVAKNNRIPMLHWLASHSLSIGDSNSNPPSNDETTIVQWYTELGVCTNREALLGECSLKEQLDTLVRLTHFVMNGFDQSQEPLDLPWDIAMKYCNSSTNIIPAASKYTGNFKYKAVEGFMERVEKEIKKARNEVDEVVVKNEINDTSRNENGEHHANNIQMKNKLLILEEFYESFKSISTKNNDREHSKNTNFIDKYMETIPQQFNMVTEVLDHEANISKSVISKGPALKENSIDDIVQEVVAELDAVSTQCN